MDGIETLEELRKEHLVPETTKIIVLTANAVAGARETYLAAGFDDYLSKPIDLEKLEVKLQMYLPENVFVSREKDTAPVAMPKKENEDTEIGDILEFAPSGVDDSLDFDPQNEDESTPGTVGNITEQIRKIGLSVEDALNYCGGDESFYAEILLDFIEDYPENTEHLEKEFKSEDWHAYRTSIHSLKSVSRTIGARALSEQAKKLEEAAANTDVTVLRKMHPECMHTYSTLVNQIAEAAKESQIEKGGQ